MAITDTTGVYNLDPDNVPHVYGYDGSGKLITDTIVFGGPSFVKTYTYTNGNITNESGWVKQ